MDKTTQTASPKTIVSNIVATAAAIGASLCCLGPVVLISLGVGGSWMSSLTALEPYRPIFIAVTVVFLWLAYRQLYSAASQCSDADDCSMPTSLRQQRFIFWVIALLAIALVTFPYYGMLLLK